MRAMRLFALLLPLALLLGCPPPVTASVGGPCTSEGVGRCETDGGTRLLQCSGGAYVVYADCKGAKGCRIEGDTVDCDTSGNSVGDRCPPTSEGLVRCDPDAGSNILRCEGGTLRVEFPCENGRVCGLTDAGLTCVY
jgi:hypothetical protein